MGFFTGFAKGFADGYNADVAARKAAELEKQKFQLNARYKASIEKNVNDSANTVNFGTLITSDNQTIDLGIVKDYNESDKLLATENNISTLNDLFYMPISQIAANQGIASNDNRTFASILKNSEADEQAMASYIPTLYKMQTFLDGNIKYIENKNNKINKDKTLFYKYPLSKFNNPYLNSMNDDTSIFNMHRKKDMITAPNINIDVEGIKTAGGQPINKNDFAKFTHRAVVNRSVPADRNLETGLRDVAGPQENLLEIGLLKDENLSPSENVLMAGYHVSKLGNSFYQLADNKKELNELIGTYLMNPANADKAYYISNYLDMQKAIAFNIKRNAQVNLGGNYFQPKTLDELVEKDKTDFGKKEAAYNNAMKSVRRTEGILTKLKDDPNMPLGIWQTASLYLRGTKDAKNQIAGMVDSVRTFSSGFFEKDPAGENFLFNDFQQSSNQLSGAAGIINNLQTKYGKNMTAAEFHQQLSFATSGRPSSFKLSKKEIKAANEANVAIVKYHSYLLAFEMAAAIQGGGDSRTISDRDVNLMQQAISARLLTAGADFKGVVTEIKQNMESVAQYHGLFYNAVSNNDAGLYRAAKLLTGPGGYFDMGLKGRGKFTDVARAVALSIAPKGMTIEDLNKKDFSTGKNTEVESISESEMLEMDQKAEDIEANRSMAIDNQDYYDRYGTWGNYGKNFESAYTRLQDEGQDTAPIVKGLYNDFKKYYPPGGTIDDFVLLFDNGQLQEDLKGMDK